MSRAIREVDNKYKNGTHKDRNAKLYRKGANDFFKIKNRRNTSIATSAQRNAPQNSFHLPIYTIYPNQQFSKSFDEECYYKNFTIYLYLDFHNRSGKFRVIYLGQKNKLGQPSKFKPFDRNVVSARFISRYTNKIKNKRLKIKK